MIRSDAIYQHGVYSTLLNSLKQQQEKYANAHNSLRMDCNPSGTQWNFSPSCSAARLVTMHKRVVHSWGRVMLNWSAKKNCRKHSRVIKKMEWSTAYLDLHSQNSCAEVLDLLHLPALTKAGSETSGACCVVSFFVSCQMPKLRADCPSDRCQTLRQKYYCFQLTVAKD